MPRPQSDIFLLKFSRRVGLHLTQPSLTQLDQSVGSPRYAAPKPPPHYFAMLLSQYEWGLVSMYQKVLNAILDHPELVRLAVM